MKIIFLDIDGVLNSYRNVMAYGGYPFPGVLDGPNAEHNLDPIAIGMIRRLCKEFGAKIVLSSTWRLHVGAVAFGFKYNLPIIGATNGNVGKPTSIKEYLATHPEIDNYIVIDDDEMHVGGRQVWTTANDGFVCEQYFKAQKKLAMKEGTGLTIGHI